MSQDLTQARLRINSVSQPLKEGKVGQALAMLADGLEVFLRAKLFRAEKEELEKSLDKAVYRFNVTPEYKKLFPEPLKYTPGREKDLYDTLRFMAQEFHNRQEMIARHESEALEEKKAKGIQKGKELLAAGEVKRAVLLFRKFAQEVPLSAEQLAEIGHAFLDAEHPVYAAEFLDLALRKSPDNIRLLVQMGTILRGLQKHDEAEKCYLEALDKGAISEALYFNLGRLYSETRRWNDAYEMAQKALEINPSFDPGKKLMELAKRKLFG